jgi:carboxymethylenebutenolidase
VGATVGHHGTVTQFSGYLTEEVVEDYADGVISRREALRRLGLLGVAIATAVPLLAACDAGSPQDAAPPTGGTAASPAGPSARATEAIRFGGPGASTLQGAWSPPTTRAAGCWWCTRTAASPTIRSVAGHLAASGYSALAVDLLSEEGGTGSFGDEAEVTAALNQVPDSRFVADMKAALDEIGRRTPGARLGAVGFCFGGGMVWTLLASGEPRLAAAAPFYGPLPDAADFSGSRTAAVLGVYAEQDGRVNATRDAATRALESAGLTHEIVTFPNAGHAFFNDAGARYSPAAAAAAYQKLLGWFGDHLG